MNYRKSVELARAHGYEEIIDENAHRGCFFRKDGKIWIHNIVALKRTLGINSDEELLAFGYDVDNYHKYKNYTNKMVDDELTRIYNAITHEQGVAVYLNDGMWLLPDGSIEER